MCLQDISISQRMLVKGRNETVGGTGNIEIPPDPSRLWLSLSLTGAAQAIVSIRDPSGVLVPYSTLLAGQPDFAVYIDYRNRPGLPQQAIVVSVAPGNVVSIIEGLQQPGMARNVLSEAVEISKR